MPDISNINNYKIKKSLNVSLPDTVASALGMSSIAMPMWILINCWADNIEEIAPDLADRARSVADEYYDFDTDDGSIDIPIPREMMDLAPSRLSSSLRPAPVGPISACPAAHSSRQTEHAAHGQTGDEVKRPRGSAE
jgi:hypothetical protein